MTYDLSAADTGAATPYILGTAAAAAALYVWMGSRKTQLNGLSGLDGKHCVRFGRNSRGQRVCRRFSRPKKRYA